MKATLITARLTLRTPGGVTAPENLTSRPTPDGEAVRNVLPLRRDPAGHLHVPGATIAGSLRHHCRDVPLLHGVFGSTPGEDVRVPSAVQVLGCVLHAGPPPVERTRTAIDRRCGAAHAATLHTVEQLPAGTVVDVVLRWNDAPADQLEALVEALRRWTPRLGRSTSTGAGRCAMTHLGRLDYDLATAAGLTAWLALANTPDRAYPEPTEITTPVEPDTHRAVRFTIIDALHVGTGHPLRSGGHNLNPIVRHGTTPMIPGASLKGVLRSRAETISRLCGVPVCPGVEPSRCDLDQPCVTCRLFGRAAATNGTGTRRGLVAIPDTPIEGHSVQHRTHVALDRFTGGGQDSLLYTDEVVVTGHFTLRVEPLGRLLGTAEAALLDAVIADLDDGLAGIGGGTTTGYGTVGIDDPTWTTPDLGGLAELLRQDAA